MKIRVFAALCAGILTACAAGGCSGSDSSDSRESSSAAESSTAQTTVSVTEAEKAESSEDERSGPPDPVSEADSSAAEPEIEVVTDPLDELAAKLPDAELEETAVRRLYTAGLGRDAEGQAMPSERLFEKKYGGHIETETVLADELFGKLAAMVMSGEAPDLVPTDSMDLFPRGVSENLFMPIDTVIAPSEGLWSSTEELSAFFAFRGKRYAVVFEAVPKHVCVYNKKTIRENGLKDPAQIYSQSEWTHGWFETLCRSFTEGGDGRTAISGSCLGALSETTGVPLITMRNGQIVSNLEDETLAAAEEWMYSLAQQGFCRDVPLEGLAGGKALFCPVRLDAVSQSREQLEGFGDPGADEVMFLPLPNDGTPYISAELRGYFIGAGSRNTKGAKAYLNCLAAADEADSEAEERRLMEVCGWNEDMIVMRRECFRLASESPVLDCSGGMPGETFEKLLKGITESTMSRGSASPDWEETVDRLSKQVDFAVMTANDTEPTGP